MYQQKQKDAYQSIKAPKDLRWKVLEACECAQQPRFLHIRRPMQLACTMAALFLFCFLGIHRLTDSGAPITIQASGPIISDGSVLVSSDPIMASEDFPELARFTQEQETISILLELNIASPAEITISGGEAAIQDADSTILTAGCSYEAASDLTMVWTIPTGEAACEMTIFCEDVTYYLPLTYDGNKDSWMIRCLTN